MSEYKNIRLYLYYSNMYRVSVEAIHREANLQIKSIGPISLNGNKLPFENED